MHAHPARRAVSPSDPFKARGLDARCGARSSLHFQDAQEQARALSGWNQDYLQLSAGLNNVFDKDPPNLGTFFFYGVLPTNYQNYDIVGRRYTAGLRFRF